ncbi:helix-turn-helix domain-containing protein [Moheibacter sp.]|uniref:helix-turn-helix domain-containing protein n=1 Tax=Moheibacter sp. TaxID=1965316 RepID=UPI003C71001D
MNFTKFFIPVFFFCFFSSVSAQKNKDIRLDSLEQKLSEIHKTHPEEAIEIGELILNHSNSEIQRSRVLGLMAVSYFIDNEITKSTELLFEAKSEAEKSGNRELIAKMNGSIAHQYVQLNLNEKAKVYLEKAIQEIDLLDEGSTKYFLKGLSFLEMGNIMYDEKNYMSANSNYKKSLKQFQTIIEPGKQVNYHYKRSLYNIGNSYLAMGETDSAEWYLNKSLTLKNDENSELVFFIYTTLAQTYAEKGFYQRAVDSLRTILENPQFKNTELRSEIYLNLSKNYKSLGDDQNYSFFNEKYLELSDSLKTSNLKAVHKAFDEEQKEMNSALTKAGKRNQVLLISGVILVILFLIIVVYLNYKRKKERDLFRKIISELEEEKTEEFKEEESQKDLDLIAPSLMEEEILQKLKKFEESEKFTHPNLNISTLAVQLKTNTTYLSEVINKYKKKNFNAYINELRIHYICEKIYKHPEFLNYKISYLATQSGFASHSAFATVFKNVTGISPSVFLREAAKRESYKPQVK